MVNDALNAYQYKEIPTTAVEEKKMAEELRNIVNEIMKERYQEEFEKDIAEHLIEEIIASKLMEDNMDDTDNNIEDAESDQSTRFSNGNFEEVENVDDNKKTGDVGGREEAAKVLDQSSLDELIDFTIRNIKNDASAVDKKEKVHAIKNQVKKETVAKDDQDSTAAVLDDVKKETVTKAVEVKENLREKKSCGQKKCDQEKKETKEQGTSEEKKKKREETTAKKDDKEIRQILDKIFTGKDDSKRDALANIVEILEKVSNNDTK